MVRIIYLKKMGITHMFKQKDVLRIFPDLTARQLIHWAQIGIIRPHVEGRDPQTPGRGKWRQYSLKNLYQIGIILELLMYGISLWYIRALLNPPGNINPPLSAKNMDGVMLIRAIRGKGPHESPPPSAAEFFSWQDFQSQGVEKLVESHPNWVTASSVVINLRTIKEYVDRQVQE
jgi:DNA-binding transcriptional MerR regulator